MSQVKCNKVFHRIECLKCEYPYSEAMYPDDYDDPLPCDCSDERIIVHLSEIHRLRQNQDNHPCRRWRQRKNIDKTEYRCPSCKLMIRYCICRSMHDKKEH